MTILHTKKVTSSIYLDAVKIRQEVFIIEQGVAPDLEIDQYEDKCIYFVLYSDDNEAVATCRLLPLNETTIKLQRMAVQKKFRGKDYGRLIIEAVEKYGKEQGYQTITLGAQITAIGFYEKLEYTKYGKKFLDAGIEHYNMEKNL